MVVERKKMDSRINSILKNCVLSNTRAFYILVGDNSNQQISTLSYLLQQSKINTRISLLWTYKHSLEFSSNTRQRNKQEKKNQKKNKSPSASEERFNLFLTSTQIRYCYYKDTDKILGQTFDIVILQDFEALTPNLLAKTIETCAGGGIVILTLKTISSLKMLYQMSMDVHSRYRTNLHKDIVARFNERFILSLSKCQSCLVLDDQLNVLPISAGKSVKLLTDKDSSVSSSESELKELKESLKDTQPIGSLLSLTKTLDQAKALLTFIEAIQEKTLSSTVTLTAARGRGKSAALGIAVASAISHGYSNIFLTSPTPENIKTLFEFILKSFDVLGLEEHLDYDIIQSTNPQFYKSIVRIDIFKNNRQTIQWILPTDYRVCGQAELIVIDEAAAIPLMVVQKLLGPCLVFMASTINGYEGTGRSLSLKLIKQLRTISTGLTSTSTTSATTSTGTMIKNTEYSDKKGNVKKIVRSLREIKLEEPIRYSKDDPVEHWLNALLCLDCCTPSIPRQITGCPHPTDCNLYYVTRDTLFSHHPVSEKFLQAMMSLYVSSHYKNSPNDLQLLSDAPGHHLFVLLPPPTSTTILPDPLCVVQVCIEGCIATKSGLESLSRGVRESGDLIPWVLTQQFQDDEFGGLSGGRVVRIATHPEYTSMGYGSRAIALLEEYYRGDVLISEDILGDTPRQTFDSIDDDDFEMATLQSDVIRVKDPSKMPPLLLKLSERPLVERLDWLGVSFGITKELHKFWKRSGYSPVYLRQTPNEITGEHTCIMLKQLDQTKWLSLFNQDFSKRFLELLSFQFKSFQSSLVLGLLEPNTPSDPKKLNSSESINQHFTPYDLKRLESYSQNLLDYHVILDLVPRLAMLYFTGSLDIKYSAVQSSILVSIGLQKKSLEEVEIDLGIPVSQILALFAKSIRKASNLFTELIKLNLTNEIDDRIAVSKSKLAGRDLDVLEDWEPTEVTLTQDLNDLQTVQREAIDSLDLQKYHVAAGDWEIKPTPTGVINVPNPASTKNKRGGDARGTADGLMKGVVKDGVFDPQAGLKDGKAGRKRGRKG